MLTAGAWLRDHPMLLDGCWLRRCSRSALASGRPAAPGSWSPPCWSACCSPPRCAAPAVPGGGVRGGHHDRRRADRVRHADWPTAARRSAPSSPPPPTRRSWCCCTRWPRTGPGGSRSPAWSVCLLGHGRGHRPLGPRPAPRPRRICSSSRPPGSAAGPDRVGARRLGGLPLPARVLRLAGGARRPGRSRAGRAGADRRRRRAGPRTPGAARPRGRRVGGPAPPDRARPARRGPGPARRAGHDARRDQGEPRHGPGGRR